MASHSIAGRTPRREALQSPRRRGTSRRPHEPTPAARLRPRPRRGGRRAPAPESVENGAVEGEPHEPQDPGSAVRRGGGRDGGRGGVGHAASCEGVNVLTPAEKTAGWQLLFDGKTTGGWHGYNGKATPAWSIDDCALKTRHRGQLRQRQAGRPRDRPRVHQLRDQHRLEGHEGRQQRPHVRSGGGQEVRRAWKTGPSTSSSTTWAFPRSWSRGSSRGRTTRCTCPTRRSSSSRWGVEQHEDRREREPRRALAQRQEDRGVRALDGRVEEAPRLRQVEGGAGLRSGQGRPHRPPGPRSVFWFRNVKIRPLPEESRRALHSAERVAGSIA